MQIARNAISSDLKINVQGKIPLKERWEICEMSFHFLANQKDSNVAGAVTLGNTASGLQPASSRRCYDFASQWKHWDLSMYDLWNHKLLYLLNKTNADIKAEQSIKGKT